jgi:hypothetical protein
VTMWQVELGLFVRWPCLQFFDCLLASCDFSDVFRVLVSQSQSYPEPLDESFEFS